MIEAWFSSSLMTRSPSPSDRPQHAGVGCEAGLEDERRLGVLEGGQLLLQLFVDGHGADDRTHGAGAHAPALNCRLRCLAQLGVRGQAEIVVRR